MLSAIVYISSGLVAICYLSDWLFSFWDDPQEPPRARPQVPLIGHVLGLLKSGTSYYTQLSLIQSSEVYTIGIFNFKIYVINSRRLIPHVQRLSKTLSFTPFQRLAAKQFINCSKYTLDLHDNTDFMREFDTSRRAALSPGSQLDYQNLRTINSLNDSVKGLLSKGSATEPVHVGLYEWSKHAITLAATDGVFGDFNPFRNKDVSKAFWAWNDGIPLLVAGMSTFAPKAISSRQKLVDAFNGYLSQDYDDAAEVTKEQIRVLTAYGAPKDDIARMQVNFGVALLSNTAPTTFWTLYNIFSQPELLQDLRSELEEHAVSSRKDEFEIDVVAIKQKCNLLLSIFEETQRTLTIHANIRQVMEDTQLENHRLKKGNYVQIPNAPIHKSTELWGADSAKFDARRFIKKDGVAMASSLPPHSFLAWGTAPHLCPARQFASTEIMVMAALLVLRVEISPVEGKWKRPEPRSGDMVTILPPKSDFNVTVRERYGWEGKWSLKMGESKSRVPLASG